MKKKYYEKKKLQESSNTTGSAAKKTLKSADLEFLSSLSFLHSTARKYDWAYVCVCVKRHHFFLYFRSKTISNIRDNKSDDGIEDGADATDTEAMETQATEETNFNDPVFGHLNQFLNDSLDIDSMEDFGSSHTPAFDGSGAFRPISSTSSVAYSPTPTTTTTPASVATSRSSEKRRATSTATSFGEEADALAQKNAANDEKFMNLLSGLVASKTANAEEKKQLTATEKLIEGLAKIITTFPMKDQLEMTNRISSIVHERALEIEARPRPT